MLPSKKQIADWLIDAQKRGAIELIIGLDAWGVRAPKAELCDDDYFSILIWEDDDGCDRDRKRQAAFRDPFYIHEATYRIPRNARICSENVQDFCKYESHGIPPQLLYSMWSTPNRPDR